MAQQYAGTEREVAYYADILCITPKYLSQVSRTITGLPASQWIQFYASFELVSLLNDTTKTLTEVSDLMHFENVSHFSRYVKKTLGKEQTVTVWWTAVTAFLIILKSLLNREDN
ncbi:helix-turn-helix domain-containing protein [Sodaliphilus pleomorphus]|uniref:helix-turn-helix domain-containing protein n=1 Tax=Sodaliphilus pleomorphus TaxID=2606626 RepID=UPI0024091313|nr:helix-turn-helix domain-containing protein [Sodaliphilus pleomorphus]MDD6687604.1 helix-turn-helix domain-containing protein [Sodaliphilus pleomorphus]